MLPPDVLAYPVMLAAIYGVYRVGRGSGRFRDEHFELVRLCSLAGLLGALVAIMIHLASVGMLDHPASILAGALGVASSFALAGLQILAWWEARHVARGGSFPAA